jgi:ABC-type Fe3+ transport system substrate-binding protein
MIRRRDVLRSGAAVPLAALFQGSAARAEPDAALVTAAQKEGTLTYYFATSADVTQRWNAGFTRKYGVQIKNVRGPSYPLYDRWMNEERVGKHIADLVCFTDPSILEGAHAEGFIADYVSPEGAAIPPAMKRDGIWYAATLAYMGVGWNTNLVTPAEEQFLLTRQWDVLADPRWQDRYTTTAAASGGSTYAYWYMLVYALQDRYGYPFLRRLAANKPGIFISKPPMYDRLVAGEYAVADQASTDLMGDLYLKGAPIRWMFPEMVPAAISAHSVSAHAPHPNAARLFQEWSLSAEGQAEWQKYTTVLPTRPDVEDARKTGRKDWWGESWFAEPKTLYLDYLREADYADPAKPIIPEWNRIFGYNGGEK